MKDVVTTSAVFFNYALLAVFAQNAVFTRALGVSRLVQLVGDDRTSSWLFGMQLCITQILVTPFAWYAGSRIAPLANRVQLRPLVYIASIAVVCLLLWLRRRTLRTRTVAKGPTWGCGFTAPNVRMQYTGESFSEGLQSIATSLTQNLSLIPI